MSERVLQGGIEYNDYSDIAKIQITKEPQFEMPESTTGQKILYSFEAFTDYTFQAVKEIITKKDVNTAITGIRLIDDNIISSRFVALDVIISTPKEGFVQALITGTTSAGTTYTLGRVMIKYITEKIFISSSIDIILIYILVAAMGFYIPKLIDAGYDWAEEKYLDWKYNESSDRLMLVTDIEDVNEIALLINEITANPEVQKYQDKIAVKQIINGKEKIYVAEKYEQIKNIAKCNNTTEEKLFELNPWIRKRIINNMFVLINSYEKIILPENKSSTWRDAQNFVIKAKKIINSNIPDLLSEHIPEVKINLFYNNNDISEIFKPYIKSITYKDYIDNHCDTLEIELSDIDNLFCNEWYLDKGAKIKCIVSLDDQILNCGTFSIDKINSVFSPNYSKILITAIAIPADVPISRKNSNSFEKTHIRDIAQFYADKYNFEFIANEDKGLVIERAAQIDVSDMKFLSDLAYKYGYIFKLTDHTLTFLRLPEQNPVFDLDKDTLSFIDISDSTTKKSGYIEFFNPDKKDLDCIQIGKLDNNIVQIQERFNSRAEGQVILSTEINRTNKDRKGTLALSSPIGNFTAGNDFNLKDFGVHDGVYRITKSVHKISSEKGWEVFGEFEQCEEITKSVVNA